MSRYYEWWEEEPNEFKQLLQEQQASIMIGKQDLTHREAPEEVQEERIIPDTCPDCEGKGGGVVNECGVDICPTCNSIGQAAKSEPVPYNMDNCQLCKDNTLHFHKIKKTLQPETRIVFEPERECPDCGGSAYQDCENCKKRDGCIIAPSVLCPDCPTCHGTGQAKRKLQPETRIVFEPERECPDCGGWGAITETIGILGGDQYSCTQCNGTGKLGHGPEVKEAVQKKLFSLGWAWRSGKKYNEYSMGSINIRTEKMMSFCLGDCSNDSTCTNEGNCKSWPIITPPQLFEEY